MLDVINDKFRRFIKDDASRLAYYNQILDDWLNKRVKLTGQLSVNAITDDMIEKFKNHKKSKKQDNNEKEDNKKEKRAQINESFCCLMSFMIVYSPVTITTSIIIF